MNNQLDLYLEQFAKQLGSNIKDVTPLANRMHAIAAGMSSERALEFKDKVRRLWIEIWNGPQQFGVPLFTSDEITEKPYKELKIDLLKHLNFPLAKNQYRFHSSSFCAVSNKLLELIHYGPAIVKIIYPYTSSYATNYWITSIAEAYAFTERIRTDETHKGDNTQIWICSVSNEMSMDKALGRYVEGNDGTGHLDLIWGGGGREIEKLGSRKEKIPSLSANTRAGLLHVQVKNQNGGQLFRGQDGLQIQQWLAIRIWQNLIHYRSKLLDLERVIRMSGIALEFYAEGNHRCQELKFSDFDTAMDG